jgi:hypothetical protein
MALGTVAFNTECGFSVVTATAGFTLLHLLHGDFFVLFGVGVELVVALDALEAYTGNMRFMAEKYISPIVLQRDVAAADHGKSLACDKNSNARKNGNPHTRPLYM